MESTQILVVDDEPDMRETCRKILVRKGHRVAVAPDGRIVYRLDKFANDMIEQKFTDWSRKGICEISGRFSFRKVQSMCVTGASGPSKNVDPRPQV